MTLHSRSAANPNPLPRGAEDLADEFERQSQEGTRPEIGSFVERASAEWRGRLLLELIKVDQELRWRKGDRRLLEEYLAEWGNQLSEQQILDLLCAECLIRGILDEMPSYRELERRFPRICERVPLARIELQCRARRTTSDETSGRALQPVPASEVQAPHRLLTEGQSIRDTWTVDRFLGEGAFAEVWRVNHRFLGRQAMKVFKTIGMSIDEINRMLGEAQILSRLAHPNIVKVYDANVTSTSRGLCGFFTMEYVAGGTLEAFWRSYAMRRVPLDKAVEAIRQVCQGLAVAHRADPPIIHQDIKPQNILVGYEADGFRVRISDFGLARHVNPLTLRATARGTLNFKGPEVLQDPKSDSPKGDIFSVGTTLYLLLTDRFPYCVRQSSFEDLSRDFNSPLVLPSFHNCLIDPQLDDIVARALATDPDHRHEDAAALLADLNEWIDRFVCAAATTTAEISAKPESAASVPLSEADARRLASRAISLSRQFSQLNEAADLMEEAFNRWPGLRTEYEGRVQHWRRGVIN